MLNEPEMFSPLLKYLYGIQQERLVSIADEIMVIEEMQNVSKFWFTPFFFWRIDDEID